MKFDLGKGQSVAVRQAFLETYGGRTIEFNNSDLLNFNYPEYLGDVELIKMTKEIIERQTGNTYKHVFLTNGATGGVVISLRAYKQMGITRCITRKPPYYVKYPTMIQAAGLPMVPGLENVSAQGNVLLLDIPSNPLGISDEISNLQNAHVILDGVYFNHIYRSISYPTQKHNILVGSYSKLTGINGLRVGWIATNSDHIAKKISNLVTAEYCGLSLADTQILKKILTNFNWDMFEILGRAKLDCNRTEWQKLERFFGNVEVSPNGMFQYAPIDRKCRELLIKSEINWTSGQDLGTSEDFGRFNIGQDNQLIKQAVKAMLKNDRK